MPGREQCLYLHVNRACTYTWTGLVPTREQGLCLDVSRLLPPRKHGLCLDVNSVCTYTWTGLVRIREQGLCEQGLCPHDRKLSGGMFVAMSGKRFEFSVPFRDRYVVPGVRWEVSGVTGRRASLGCTPVLDTYRIPVYRLQYQYRFRVSLIFDISIDVFYSTKSFLCRKT